MNAQLMVLCSLQLTVCSMFTLIGPFYPKRAEEAGVSLTIVGLIFSLNPIGQLCACIPTGYYLKQIGRRKGILWALSMMSISILLLGAVDFCDFTWFIILSVISRFLCGVASGIFFTILMAIISSNFTASLQMAIMYIEVSAGIGLLAGPAFGSVLFYFGGYFMPFLVFGLYFAASVPVVYKLLGPDRSYNEKNADLNAGVLVKHRSILFDLLGYALLMYGIGVQSPVIVLHLMSFGLSNEAAAMLSLLGTMIYMIASPIVAKLPKTIDLKLVIALGLLIFASSYYIMGPVAPFPSELTWVMLGISLGGIGFAMVYIPCMPSMIKTSTEELGLCNDDVLADSLSSIMNFTSALGEIFGPVLGGYLFDVFGSEVTFGSVALLGLGYFFVYYHFSFRHQFKKPLLSADEKEATLELNSSLISKNTSD